MQAVIGLGGFTVLIVILYGPWQEICTDFARQIVFEKRDAIFDLAHSGKLSFKSREYGTIRSSLQASIRFAHELTLPRFFLLAAGLRKQGSHPEDNELSRAINQISDPVMRNRVDTLVKDAYRPVLHDGRKIAADAAAVRSAASWSDHSAVLADDPDQG
jgi:hypothetical protein